MIMIKVTDELLDTIKQYLQATQCTGLTSVGCGEGELEAALAQRTGMPVVGVDREAGMVPEDRLCHITFVKAFKDTGCVVPVDEAYGLMFCCPDSNMPFEDYLAGYRGRCLFIIVYATCVPDPGEWKPKGELQGWTSRPVVTVKGLTDNDDDYTGKMYVFTRPLPADPAPEAAGK